ncbi:Kinase [Hexamita inflata]|uniref:dual-specificity kinase n=1 Tax=Hexamita inflata TaxID=28002 RepID=A0AA86QZX4_9EUKA|nr:CMGC DYRK [Hexamita inflata]
MAQFRKFKTTQNDEQQQNLIPPPPKELKKPGYKGRRNQAQPTVAFPEIQREALPEVTKNFESSILKGSSTPRRAATNSKTPNQEEKHTGAYILSTQSNQLTKFEQTEILQYQRVSYWGQNANKKYNISDTNFGYDDNRGDYLGVLKDHIAYRYETQSILGQGSFGKVFKAFDHQNNCFVALKIVRNKKRFHRQGLVEVRLLETLRKNDPDDISCVLKLTHSFYFRSHLCIVTDMLSINLYELLVRFNLKGLKLNYVKHIAVQCLNSLCYSHNLNIIHADIKPENILLVKENSTHIRVIDWGSGAFVNQTIYTYIQSRFYRAPEVILGMPYSIEIDVWSMGCVFAELLTGMPIFPGEDEHDQLGKICEFLNMPPNHMIQKASRAGEFFQSGKLRSKHRPNSKSIQQHLKGQPADFIDLICQMLVWDPKQRATPHQLMKHQFVVNNEYSIQMVGQLGQGAVTEADKAKIKEPETENKFQAEEMGFKKPKSGTGSQLGTSSVQLPDLKKI